MAFPVPAYLKDTLHQDPLQVSGYFSFHLSGNTILKVVPLPSSLSTVISPICCVTTCFTSGSPIPKLSPFVVKNGSNILLMISFGMPDPVSDMESNTLLPSADVDTDTIPASGV